MMTFVECCHLKLAYLQQKYFKINFYTHFIFIHTKINKIDKIFQI